MIYDNDDDDDDDDVDDDDDDDDKRCFRASFPLIQGIEKVGLLAIKLVLNLTLTPMQFT